MFYLVDLIFRWKTFLLLSRWPLLFLYYGLPLHQTLIANRIDCSLFFLTIIWITFSFKDCTAFKHLTKYVLSSEVFYSKGWGQPYWLIRSTRPNALGMWDPIMEPLEMGKNAISPMFSQFWKVSRNLDGAKLGGENVFRCDSISLHLPNWLAAFKSV